MKHDACVASEPVVHGQWSPDPYGRYRLRYWDGDRWTEWVADGTDAFDERSPVIVIRRASWYAFLRRYRVFIDGERVGALARGETGVFPVAAGDHRVRVKLDWARSREVVVSVPPVARLSCGPRGGAIHAVALMFVQPRRALRLDGEDSVESPPAPALVVAGYVFYFAFIVAVLVVVQRLIG